MRAVVALLVVGLAVQGCATTATLSHVDRADRALVMSGTRLNLALIDGERTDTEDKVTAGVPRYPWLDLPFSFALDAMLLAFTVPTAVILHLITPNDS